MLGRRGALPKSWAECRCSLPTSIICTKCKHLAFLPHDGFLALSRNCYFHARPGTFSGITMDERIRNLMQERGHEDLLMNVDDPDLEQELLLALDKLAREGESIAQGIGRTGCAQSESHGAHGCVL